jgi:hypothetical protein
MAKVHLLDYVAGNIRSLVNAIEKCGYEVEWVQSPEDVQNAEVCLLLLCCTPHFLLALSYANSISPLDGSTLFGLLGQYLNVLSLSLYATV